MSSLKILSVNIARRQFRVGEKVYVPGEVITDPGAIPFFSTKRKDGKIVELTEHNLQDVAAFLTYRQNVKGAEKLLKQALADRKYSDPAYVEKVLRLADENKIDTEGKTIKELVVEIKAVQKG